MNKKEAMQEIETIKQRLAVLEGIVREPQGLPKFGPNGEGWYLDSIGRAQQSVDLAFCKEFELYGVCFPTREAAEKAAPLFARAHKIIQAALMADPDAGVRSHDRYMSVALDQAGIWRCWEDRGGYALCPVYVHTREQAERMAQILNAEGVV